MISTSKWNFPCLITLRGRGLDMNGGNQSKLCFKKKRKEKAITAGKQICLLFYIVSAKPCDEVIPDKLLSSYKCYLAILIFRKE